jgi:hypothetical protein
MLKDEYDNAGVQWCMLANVASIEKNDHLVVDVTGHLGGYNFQWAWASGYAAGQAA